MTMLMKATPNETMSSIDLLKIINDARAQKGESVIRANDFHARVADELDGDHYESFVVQNPNKTTTTGFSLNKDQCTLVAMRESKGVRRNVLDQLKQLQAPRQPSKIELAQWFIESETKLAQVTEQLAIAAPKAIALDRIADTESLFTIRESAKTLKIKERDLVALLLSRGWAFRDGRSVMQPYAEKIAAGYVTSVMTKPITGPDGQERVFSQLRITSKGVARLAQILAKGVAA